MVFYAEGRLVTLESKKEDGYSTALLWFRETEIPNDPGFVNFRYRGYEIRSPYVMACINPLVDARKAAPAVEGEISIEVIQQFVTIDKM